MRKCHKYLFSRSLKQESLVWQWRGGGESFCASANVVMAWVVLHLNLVYIHDMFFVKKCLDFLPLVCWTGLIYRWVQILILYCKIDRAAPVWKLLQFSPHLGISNFSLSESFSVLVPYATSWRKEGLAVKSRKWSTFAGSSWLRCNCGGSIAWPGLLMKVCFLASSLLHLVRPGMKLSNSDFEWSQTKMDSICCLVYQEFAASYSLISLESRRLSSGCPSFLLLYFSTTLLKSHVDCCGAIASSAVSTAWTALRLW